MRVFVINLVRRTERRALVESELRKHKFPAHIEWFPAWDANDFETCKDVVIKTRCDPNARVWFYNWMRFNEVIPDVEAHNKDMNDSKKKRWIAKVCCYESHRSVWKRLVEGSPEEGDWALILEDDITINYDFEKVLPQVPSDPMMAVSLGRHYWADKKGQNGTDAYLIHRDLAKHLLKNLDICEANRKVWLCRNTPDDGLGQAVEAGLFKAKAGEKLVEVAEFPSDIERKD